MGQQINDSGVFSGQKIVDVSGVNPPVTVALYPGPGNTSRWEYSATPGAAGNPAAAKWWPGSGDVTGPTIDTIEGACHAIRFIRVSGSDADEFEVTA
ncbi:hypothetical protein [Methylococcus mesophilus]|uniref:hypothetical protein n=1 Tax=Methylococcus mesophilus TaxID=2993564 RepID=UPI00224B4FF4|nr:hypothetical protein [Methylococcus mesophilus]UZR27437.1 hypothetical protein OOT43_11900 [Methylococcus mesophilus]